MIQNLCIRFDKTDGFIRIYDETKYLTLFGSEKNEAIYNRIRYLISLKSGITYISSHYFAKIKFDSCDSSPIETRLTLLNVIIIITTTIRYNSNDNNHYYYKIFLEKCLCQLAKKITNFCS